MALFCGVLLALCLLSLSRMQVGENAAAMLPDQGDVVVDFELLQKAPFAKRLAISISDDTGLGPDRLTSAAKELADALKELGAPLVTSAMAGPPGKSPAKLAETLYERLPSLADAVDLEAIKARLVPEAVGRALEQDLLLLQSPQSFILEGLLQKDPLGLREFALAKLRAVNMLPRMRLYMGRFLSQDRRHALVLAETQIPLTDVGGAEKLLKEIDNAIDATLPEGCSASIIGAHGYTVANAAAIKADLKRILTLSCIGLGLLFGLAVRSWRVLFVLMVPAVAYLVGAAAVGAAWNVVSGITLGFGGVLMGICVDFALHVFLAMRREEGLPGEIISSVARPVGFSFLTTAAAFSIMLLSELPGVRQLSVFSLAGLLAAVAMALVVLPHFPLGREKHPKEPLYPVDDDDAEPDCELLEGLDVLVEPSMTHGQDGLPSGPACKLRQQRRQSFAQKKAGWIFILWLLGMAVCIFLGRNLVLEGDLRKLAVMPESLLSAELEFKQTWGDVRGQAMLFARGDTLQKALQANETAYQQLVLLMQPQVAEAPSAQVEAPAVAPVALGPVLSLAPLLPSQATQDARQAEWQSFWEKQLPVLRDVLLLRAKDLGFSENAFAPFFEYLQEPPASMTAGTLREMGLGAVLDMLTQGSEDGFQVLTLLPDDPLLLRRLPQAWTSGEGPMRLVSQTRFREQMQRSLQRDFTRFLLLASGAVLVLLLLLFRSPRKMLLAAVPVASALAALAGGTGFMNTGLNIYGVLAAVLCMGLAVDYGIFMTMRGERTHAESTDQAVLLSGLSTLLGFGVLAAASHPALHSMGVAVVYGLAGALPASLLVVPALQELLRKRRAKDI